MNDRSRLAEVGDLSMSAEQVLGLLERQLEQLRRLGFSGARLASVFPSGGLSAALSFLVALENGIAAPLNASYQQAELEFYLQDLGAEALLTPPDFSPAAEAAARALGLPVLYWTAQDITGSARVADSGRGPGELALLLHTSGTTARPKLVGLGRQQLEHSAANIRQSLSLSSSDVCLCPMPLFHIHGLVAGLLAPLSAGGGSQLCPSFLAPRFLDWLESGATYYTAVPTMHQAILARARGVEVRHSLRFIRSSSSSLPPVVALELEEVLGVPVIEAYGMSEAAHQIASNPLPPGARKPGSVGLSVGCQLKVEAANGEIGEVLIQGSNVIKAYQPTSVGSAEAFHEGWLRTGDLGYIDAEGYLFLTGRVKEQINRGGEKISPREIDEALLAHPAVAQAIAFAWPDERLGEEVAAAVVLGPGQSLSASQLRRFAGQTLAHFKVPRHIVFLSELPKGPTGKPVRVGLAERLKDLVGLESSEAEEFQIEAGLLETLIGIWEDTLGCGGLGPSAHFLELGGDSILALSVIEHLQQRLGVQLGLIEFFEHPTLGELARFLQSRPQAPSEAVSAVPPSEPDSLPMTPIQEAYWLGRRSDVVLGGVACQAYWEWQAPRIDPQRLESAWQRLVRRHFMLRARVSAAGRLEILGETGPWSLEVREAPPGSVRDELLKKVHDPEQWPMFTLVLSRQPDGDRLHLLIDAILADAASQRVLWRELRQVYEHPEAELPPLETVVPTAVQPTVYERDRSYWLERCPTLPAAPSLPVAASLQQKPTFARYTRRLEASDWARLKASARQLSVTPTALCVAALSWGLSRYTESPDFSLNMTLFGQPRSQASCVGDTTGLSLLEVRVGGERLELARQIHRRLLLDLDHRSFSALDVLKALRRQSQTAALELAPVVITSLLGLGPAPAPVGELVWSCNQTPQVLLDHRLVEGAAGELLLHLDAAESHFAPGWLDDLMDEYVRCLQLDWQHESAESWQPEVQVQPRETLTAGFERSFQLSPQAPAVDGPQGSFSYEWLQLRARQLAGCGFEAGQRVAVVADSAAHSLAAELAILQSGSAFVPLDPGLPAERIRQILQEVRPGLVFVDAAGQERLGQDENFRLLETWGLDQPMADRSGPEISAGSMAYILYTSGSSGRPKGCVLTHGAVTNTLVAIQDLLELSASDRSLGLSSPGFDLSIFDSFGIWRAGGCLVLPRPGRCRDPLHWLELLQQYGVTVWNSVPALWEMLLGSLSDRGAQLGSLRHLLLSGDWIPLPLARRTRECWPELKVWSLGGATEAGIWSNFHPVDQIPSHWASIPYGRALPGQAIAVLDSLGRLRPNGVNGEIVLAGGSLAEGYWGQPEESQRRFSLSSSGVRLYRTGDVGRMSSEHGVEILGRLDLQVKIRGHRVEISEVESLLLRHPALREVAVVAVGARDSRRLLAWAVPSRLDPPPPAVVLAELKEALPEGFLPSELRWLESLPLTALGKVDRVLLQQRAEQPRGVSGRRTVRHFDDRPLSLQQLQALLAHLAQQEGGRRAYPSAGDFYPVEVVVVRRQGASRFARFDFQPASGGLERSGQGDGALEDWVSDTNRPVVEKASVLILLVGRLTAGRRKYAEQMRDFALIEAGAMLQHLMQQSGPSGVGLCPLGRLYGPWREALQLDSELEFLHAIAAGSAGSPVSIGSPAVGPMAELWKEALALADTPSAEARFLQLGGDSLRGVRLMALIRDRLGVELRLQDILENPTLESLALKALPTPRQTVAPEAVSSPMPAVSPAQERLWFLARLDPNSLAYHCPLAVEVDPGLSADLLRQRVREAVARHDSLRTCFPAVQGRPSARLLDKVPEVESFRFLNDHELQEQLRQQSARPFDLEAGPLLRVSLHQGPSQQVMLVVQHHIVTDAWSIRLLAQQLASGGGDSAGPGFWSVAGELGKVSQPELLERWCQRLSEVPASLELPLDCIRPLRQGYQGGRVLGWLASPDLKRLRSLALDQQCTLFTVVLSAWTLLLSEMAQQHRWAVATPVHERYDRQREGMLGMMVNTLILPVDIDPQQTFAALLRANFETLQVALEGREVPLEQVVERVNPARDLSRQPLAQVMINLRRFPPGWSLNEVEVDLQATPFDLSLELEEREGQLKLKLLYDRQLFRAETAERLLQRFLFLLQNLNPEAPCETQPMTWEAEQAEIRSWHRPTRPAPPLSLDQLLFQQAGLHPDAPALRFREQVWNYGQLGQQSRLAAAALQQRGVGLGGVVAVVVNEGPGFLFWTLGALCLGARVLFLDELHPEAYRLKLLGHLQEPLTVSGSEPIDPRFEPALASGAAGPEDDAFVIFTSGSTGQPKEVVITHGGLIQRCQWFAETFPARTTLMKTSPAFVDFLLEVFSTLLSGSTLVLMAPDERDRPRRILDILANHRVERLLLVPSLLQLLLPFLSRRRLRTLKSVIVSGEPLARALAERFCEALPESRLANLYGSSEASDVSWCWIESAPGHNVPIGKPLDFVSVEIRHPAGHPAGVGMVGQIWVSGGCLAQGLPDPFPSGDRGRWRWDGQLEHLGRLDRVCKVRGVRFDPHELEAAILETPGIEEVAVALVDEQLQAFWAGDCEGDPRELMRLMLPSALVPTRWVQVEALPRTRTGKVDRSRLSAIPEQRQPTSEVRVATALERRVQGIFSQVLGRTVALDDNFFQMGGHSLLGLQLMDALEREFQKKLPLELLFQFPSVASFSPQLQPSSAHRTLRYLVPFGENRSGTPLFCVHPLSGSVLPLAELAHHLQAHRPFYGIQSPTDRKLHSISELASMYLQEVRMVQPSGPYFLGGRCVGVSIAWEMAHQLSAAGEQVGGLLLFDATLFPRRLSLAKQSLELGGLGLQHSSRALKSALRDWRLLLGKPELWRAGLSENLFRVRTRLQLQWSWFRYQPSSYDGPGLVIAPSERPVSRRMLQLGPGLETFRVRANHLELLRGRPMLEVAEAVEKFMRNHRPQKLRGQRPWGSRRQKFVLLAHPRSGSNSLQAMLRLICPVIGEPFHPTRKERSWHRQATDPESLSLCLDRIFQDYQGIRHLWTQLSRNLNRVLLTHGPRVLVLWRRNVLKAVVSNFISQQTRIWGSDASRRDDVLRYNFQPVRWEKVEQVVQTWVRQRRMYLEMLQRRRVPFLEVTYEQLYESSDEPPKRLSAIMDFLELHPSGDDWAEMARILSPDRSKLNSASTYQRIPNIHEIEEKVGHPDTGFLFSQELEIR